MSSPAEHNARCVPRFAVMCSVNLPTREAAMAAAEELARRGHALVAVRSEDHFRKDPTNFWYGKPSLTPELEGWWQVFSLDEGPYPTDDEDWWQRAEARAVGRLARAHGGSEGVGGAGHLETMRRSFTRDGLTHELSPAEVAAARSAALRDQPERSDAPARRTTRRTKRARRGPITLTGLDQVDWASLSHAHGPADDVPDMVRRLAANDGSWYEALDELIGDCVLHQETCYSVTPAVVPFLAQLTSAGQLAPSRRVELLHLLFWAATIGSTGVVYGSDHAAALSRQAVESAEEAATCAAVVDVIPSLLAEWDEASVAQRHALCLLAALAPEASRPLVPRLRAFRDRASGGRSDTALDLAVALAEGDEEAAWTVAEAVATWNPEVGTILDYVHAPRPARLRTALQVLSEPD